jgi:DNA modification methylase
MDKSWPADRVERRALALLVPFAQNARTHSEVQVAQIAESMREWGFTVPLLVDEADSVIAGHGRLLAAQLLGLVEVPVIVARGWTEAQKRAYRLADNQLALNAGWDLDILGGELRGLKEWGFDLKLMGFDNLDALLARGAGLTDPDAAPPAPKVPVTQPGDAWLLGRHRLVCGDCTIPKTVELALNGVTPQLMVTDPPYGVNYDPSWRQGAGLATGVPRGKITNDDEADWRQAWALFPGAVVYVWHGGLHAGTVERSLEACGFQLRAQIVWVKHRAAISRGDYHWQHEPVWYGVKGDEDNWRFIPEHELAAYAVGKGEAGKFRGGRKQSTVWFIEHLKSSTGHGAQKPVECMKRPVENNSSPGQAVYDPFVGSGTTVIAAEMTGRVCHAIEIDPAYCDVTISRWQDFTGGRATLERDGRAFEAVAAEVAAA